MNKRIGGLSVGLAVAALFVFASGCGDDDPVASSKAKVRVIHGSYDAPAVDVAIDGTVAISGLAYGISSGYASLEAGERQVTVSAAGGGATVIDAKLTLAANQDYTVVAVDALDKIAPIVLADDRMAIADKARVRFLHAAPDAPAVDIKLNTGDGPAVFTNIAFKGVGEYQAVDEAEYTFVVTATGSTDAVVTYQPIKLEKGKTYTVIALGTLDANDSHDFKVRAFVDDGEGKASVDLAAQLQGEAQVTVVHASPDAPGVDLLIDDTKVNTAPLLFAENTGYLTLESGARNVKVAAAGGGATVIDANLTLEAAKAYTVFAINTLASIEALVLEDDLTAPAAGKAHVRFAHLSPDAPAVDIFAQGGTTALFSNRAFKDATAFTPVDAGTITLEVRAGGNTVLTVPNVNLQDGKIYTIYAKGLLAAGAANPLSASIITHN